MLKAGQAAPTCSSTAMLATMAGPRLQKRARQRGSAGRQEPLPLEHVDEKRQGSVAGRQGQQEG